MKMRTKFLLTAVVAVAIIALIGAAAAITVATVGNGASYAFWSQANDIVSTETSNTTALAEDVNPSEKYIQYDYYVIEGDVWDPTKQWTRLAKQSETPDENNISRPVFNTAGANDNGNGTTNVKAVAVKYTGNISTLNVPDTTPVFIGGTKCDAEVVEIESLNRETSPGVAIVEKLIIGRNVKAMGYSRGVSGVIIKSGMSGFRSLREVVIARNGADGTENNGMATSFDKITAVGHFFEDSPSVESMWALVYSNFNLQGVDKDKVPQKMPLTWKPNETSGQSVDAFEGQTDATRPKDFMETGIGVNHAIEDGFKRCAAAINASAQAGFTVYTDTLKTVKDGGVMKYSSGVYTVTLGGTDYVLVRNGNGDGEVKLSAADTTAVGRFEYAARTVIVTLYELNADGSPVTDELGIIKPKSKYYY